MNSYICTSKGFLKSISFDNIKKETIFEYTEHVREAKHFKASSAKKYIERNNIEGFVWKPFEEEPVRNKYYIDQRACKTDFNDFTITHKVMEYYPVRVTMESLTDAKFLNNTLPKVDEYFDTIEEATNAAVEKNKELITELINKINKIEQDKIYYR